MHEALPVLPAQNRAMAVTRILSAQNEKIRRWASLLSAKGRRAHGCFLAEGEHMAGEAVREGKALALMVDEDCLARYAGLLSGGAPVFSMPGHVLSRLCDARAPQGILALCALPPATDMASWQAAPRMVALNAVQDPGNVGTILRTMDAAGYAPLVVDEKTCDPFSPKALRASMGAVFRVPVVQARDLRDVLPALPHTVLAGHLRGESLYAAPPVPGPLCLLIGNEGAGVEDGLLPFVSRRVKIPMPGRAESLNAGVAAAVMMYEFVRRDLSP